MPQNISSSTSSSQAGSLDDLARQIRSALLAARQNRCNALHHDLAAGDALIVAQERVSSGWNRWLRENCFLRSPSASPSTPPRRRRPVVARLRASRHSGRKTICGMAGHKWERARWRNAEPGNEGRKGEATCNTT
jgi:hypothetical protein